MKHTSHRPASALFALLFLFASVSTLAAQEATPEPSPDDPTAVTVGVYVSPPFVMKEDDRFTGLAVDLWESLASQLDLATKYRELETIRDLVNATAAGEIDVAVTNLTVNESRAQRIDFTQPWFDGGLRILVNEDRTTGFWDVVEGLRSAGFLRAYAWIASIILAATVALTLFDRRFDKDFPRRWRDGIAESFYSVMSVATTGKPAARKNLFGWVGRIWQGLWLVCGVAVLAYVTSSVTSVMTTLSLTNQIHSVEDLPGKMIGVRTGSVAEDFARESSLEFRSFAHLDTAVDALLNGSITAIIGDGPVLEYYSHIHPEQPLNVVGRLFEPDKYAFALPRQSPLTRPLTLEVLGAHEREAIQDLRTKYFGENP